MKTSLGQAPPDPAQASDLPSLARWVLWGLAGSIVAILSMATAEMLRADDAGVGRHPLPASEALRPK
jgi:hypothetical protein